MSTGTEIIQQGHPIYGIAELQAMADRLVQSRDFPAITTPEIAIRRISLFRPKFEVDVTGCWLWKAQRDHNGYGRFFTGRLEDGSRRGQLAHRFSFVCFHAEIPHGMELDHLCRVTGCVNPDHLEPVDHRTNTIRGLGIPGSIARTTHCRNGHERGPINNYVSPSGLRYCRACEKANQRAAYLRRKQRISQ